MLIKIEMDSDIPIYTQLANGLIEGIANGSLQPNDPLPSVRSLAADLSVNMHTVNKAYHELDKKGIVRIIPKSGAIINPTLVDQRALDRISNYLRPVIAEALVVGIDKEDLSKLVLSIISDIKGE